MIYPATAGPRIGECEIQGVQKDELPIGMCMGFTVVANFGGNWRKENINLTR